MVLHTYNPKPMSQQNINFLHLTVSEIQPKLTIFPLTAHKPEQPPECPNADTDTMGENNTQTALMVCGIKTQCYGKLSIQTYTSDSIRTCQNTILVAMKWWV